MRPLPRLLAITDDEVCARDDFPVLAAAILSAGSAVAVVVRASAAPIEAQRGFLARVRALARPTEAAFLGFGDPELATSAQGVILEAHQSNLATARSKVPGWLGVSATTLDEARRATSLGADFLMAGPLDRPRFSDDRSVAALIELGRPVFVLGVSASDPIPSRTAGAWGIALTSGLFTAADPAKVTGQVLAQWEAA